MLEREIAEPATAQCWLEPRCVWPLVDPTVLRCCGGAQASSHAAQQDLEIGAARKRTWANVTRRLFTNSNGYQYLLSVF